MERLFSGRRWYGNCGNYFDYRGELPYLLFFIDSVERIYLISVYLFVISILSINMSVSIRRESYMFTYKELHLIDKGYFKVLRYPIEDNFIEIQSKNTRDSWIIQKRNPNVSDYPVILYHKHPGQKYYHKHWQCYNVSQCIRSIKSHDEYSMLRKWNERLDSKQRMQRRIHRQQPQLQQGI